MREDGREAAGRIAYEATLDCVHCGMCLPVCPTYQETGRETSSPRGRIYLARGVAEGAIALDGAVAHEMHFCLDCRACESVCPAGVRYGRIVESMREEIDARGVRGRWRRVLHRAVLRGTLGSPARIEAAMSLLRAYQWSGLQRALRASGLVRLVPPLARADALVPQLDIPHRPLAVVPGRGKRRGRVALFVGCVMPHLLPSVNRATVEALVHNGFDVEVPAGQGCCGALLAHDGDAAGAARLRERNRRAFSSSGIDAVVVSSAGCGAALKGGGDGLARRVRDVAELLVDVGLVPPGGSLPLRVAYDDPCHLLHAQRIAEAPRALLRAIPGLELVDLPGSQDCCGAAGIYNLTHPQMAGRLLARKIQALRELRPHALATGNPGCALHLAAGAREARLEVEVVHPVELLARAYAAGMATASEGAPRGPRA